MQVTQRGLDLFGNRFRRGARVEFYLLTAGLFVLWGSSAAETHSPNSTENESSAPTSGAPSTNGAASNERRDSRVGTSSPFDRKMGQIDLGSGSRSNIRQQDPKATLQLRVRGTQWSRSDAAPSDRERSNLHLPSKPDKLELDAEVLQLREQVAELTRQNHEYEVALEKAEQDQATILQLERRNLVREAEVALIRADLKQHRKTIALLRQQVRHVELERSGGGKEKPDRETAFPETSSEEQMLQETGARLRHRLDLEAAKVNELTNGLPCCIGPELRDSSLELAGK
jgi:hypothetical protein